VNGCRIGKVKLRNGVEVLRFPTPARDDVQKVMVEWAAYIAASFKPGELNGFCVMAWSKDNTLTEIQIITPDAVSTSTAPAYVAEEVRRQLHRKGYW